MDTPPRPDATVGAAARYRTLLEINNAVISNLTQDALFHAIAQALRGVVAFDRTAVFLHDPERDVLRLFVLESSLSTSYFTVGLEMPSGESHVGRVFKTQRSLLRHDLAKERQCPMEDRALEDGVRSYVIVPLVVRSTAIGTLAVASVKPNQYSEADAEFLRDAAGQIALAIENMKAYQEIAALKARLEHENVYLQEEIHREHNFVLVSGETGTGKELVARAIHDRSTRRGRPLVKVNCSAIAAGLVESELFGHVKGAFTGAIDRRVGRFELADGGTLFLDEVGELPLETQVKLLRVLQEREFEPVGSSRSLRVDVRVIAATNRDLAEAVRAGRFRADLFYRLNVFPIEVPPLRERRTDIPQLATFFVSRFARKFGKRVEAVSKETLDRLMAYPWPGNIRELQNVIERAVVLSSGPSLELGSELLPASAPLDADGARARPESASPAPPAPASLGLDAALEAVERSHILAALEGAGWVIEGARGAAKILKLHPNTLRSRMEKLRIRRRSDEPFGPSASS